jgi:uncharacterized protein
MASRLRDEAKPVAASPHLILSTRQFSTAGGERVRLAYDGGSGATFVVAIELAELLASGRVVEHADLLEHCLSIGMLSEGDDAGLEIMRRAKEAAAERAHRSFTLLPSSYCNMGCDYCGQSHRPGGWSHVEREATIRRVVSAAHDPACESVTVRWFGGEPLANYPAVVEVGSAIAAALDAGGKPLVGHMVTNGSLLTRERLRTLVRRCGISTYEITVDGPREVHDTRRLLKDGGKSYERILTTVRAALDDPDLGEARFSLRTNIDRRNANRIDEYLHDLADRGLAHDRVLVNLQPVHDWSNDTSSVRLDVLEYAHRERGWMMQLSTLGLRFGVLPAAPKALVCAAVTRAAEIVDASNSIFSCSEHPFVTAHQSSALGSVEDLEGQLRPAGDFDYFHVAIERGDVPCRACPLLGVCGGACPKAWRDGGTPCPSFKYNLQTRLEIWGALHGLRLEPGPAAEDPGAAHTMQTS